MCNLYYTFIQIFNENMNLITSIRINISYFIFHFVNIKLNQFFYRILSIKLDFFLYNDLNSRITSSHISYYGRSKSFIGK